MVTVFDMKELKTEENLLTVAQNRLELRPVSHTRWSGLCPFHAEKTASFYLYLNRGGRYHCFGCGASGDIFDFVQRLDGCTFWEAVATVSRETGIPMPQKPRKCPTRDFNPGLWDIQGRLEKCAQRLPYGRLWGILAGLPGEYSLPGCEWQHCRDLMTLLGVEGEYAAVKHYEKVINHVL